MNQNLTLAYSTCPNDTFIFHAMTHGLLDCKGYEFKTTLEDVETLNKRAENSEYDISKLSFAAIGRLRENYGLLRSGAALGRGCGPLIIARPGFDIKNLGVSPIAVPGLMTTANMLLGLYLDGKPPVVPMTFDQIMPAVQTGEYEFGVIIHEGRFTYREHGLDCIEDLGSWWEKTTSLPIPLGGIAVKRSLSGETARTMEQLISQSVQKAFDTPAASMEYIQKHAMELSETVIKSHIDLYVNQFSLSLGSEGEEAVTALFEMAEKTGVIPKSDRPLFAC